MRGTRAKQLRKHVRENGPYMMDEVHYKIGMNKVWTVAHTCKRAMYRHMKKAYKKAKAQGLYS